MNNAHNARTAAATKVADYIADDDYACRIWQGRDGDRTRVYISRTLSRGRVQDMGYVELADDGTVADVVASRRAATIAEWAETALAA